MKIFYDWSKGKLAFLEIKNVKNVKNLREIEREIELGIEEKPLNAKVYTKSFSIDKLKEIKEKLEKINLKTNLIEQNKVGCLEIIIENEVENLNKAKLVKNLRNLVYLNPSKRDLAWIEFDLPFKTTTKVEFKELLKILKQKALSLDIEKSINTNEIYSIALFPVDKGNKGKILTTLFFPKQLIQFKLFNKSYEFQVEKLPNEKELIKKLNYCINLFNPLWLIGQNLFFDLISLKENAKNKKLKFEIGLDKSEPIQINTGFFKGVKVFGRNIFDTLLISAKYYGFLLNFRLATLASFFLQEKIEKEMSYEEIEAIYEKRDSSGIEQLLEMNAKDSVYPFLIFDQLSEFILVGSKLFNIDPTYFIADSRSTLNNRKKLTRELKKVKLGKMPSKFYRSDFNFYDFKKELNLFFEKFYKLERGLKEALIIEPIWIEPFLLNQIDDQDIENQDSIKNHLLNHLFEFLIDWSKTLSLNFSRKVFLVCLLEDFLAEIAERYKENKLEKKKRKLIEEKLETIKIKWEGLFNLFNLKLFNFGRFLYIKDIRESYKKNLSKIIEKENLGIVLGTAKTLSIEKGKTIFKLTNYPTIFTESFSVTKDLPERTLAEKEFVEKFSYLIFDSQTKALEYARNFILKLKNEQFSPDYYLIYKGKEIKRNPTNWVRVTLRTKDFIEKGLEKGVIYEGLKKEIKDILGKESIIRKLLKTINYEPESLFQLKLFEF